MPKFKFNLRKPSSKSETPINLIIRWGGEKLVYSTGQRINPKFWDPNTQLAKQTRVFPQFREFNITLDKIKNISSHIFRKYENENDLKSPSKAQLKDLLEIGFHKKKGKKVCLIDFIEIYMDQSKSRFNTKGKPISPGTIRIYKNYKDRLIEYNDSRKVNIDFDDIDLKFYYDFKKFLTIDKEYSTNTIGKYIRTVKTIMHEAVEQKFTDNVAFRSKKFVSVSEEIDGIYLSYGELDLLFNIELSNSPRLDNARDLFLFCCFTGLRYSDLLDIKITQIEGDKLTLRMHKTSDKVVVPLNHRIVKSIRKKYKNITHNSLPRLISNPKLNIYIKEVGYLIESLHKIEEINKTKAGKLFIEKKPKYKLITAHTARRSFASNLLLDNAPIAQIMKVTGHKSERSFWVYIKIKPTDSINTILDIYKNK